MKVYVVTQGCYSDYHICCIFKTEEQAKTYCDEYNFFGNYEDDECSYYVEEVHEEKIEIKDKPCGVQCEFENGVLDDSEFYITENYYGEGADFTVDINQYEGRTGKIIKEIRLSFPMVARKDETLEKLKERAKKVAIDKYFEWKERGADI